ncbi:MAG: sigma-70 family RNA polymerase sigma factor [Ginsengibacter sp.]
MKPLTNLSDQQLIHLYMDGNQEALSSLIYRHKDKIYTSIYLLVNDKYLADDIFQDSFIRVINTLKSGRYKDEGKFSSWIVRIAHNLCIDHFRKIKRSPSFKTIDYLESFQIISFPDPDPGHGMLQKQRYDRLAKMLDRLPEDQREVIILKHYANLTFKEIGTLTKCSINTALGRMHYGLINLRKMMVEKQIAL